jgi:hypothetical protein
MRPNTRLAPRPCKVCETPFKPIRKDHEFCNQNCSRVYRLASPETRDQKIREFRLKMAGLCVVCGERPSQKNNRCEECRLAFCRDRDRQLRLTALNLYGAKCTCCGEKEIDFLAFDHVNNDGYKERKVRGHRLYWRLIKHRPTDIQIHCHNCNMAKGFYGICPHQRAKPQLVCEAA